MRTQSAGINVLTSTVTTLLIMWATVAAITALRKGELTNRTRLLLLFWIVLGANAVLSYAYNKDVIMSPAGTLYAAAAFAAISLLLERSRAPRGLVIAVCLALSIGWTSRTAGLFYALRYQAYRQANDWAFMEDVQTDGLSPTARLVIERLRRQMVAMDIPSPLLVQRTVLEKWLDQSQ